VSACECSSKLAERLIKSVLTRRVEGSEAWVVARVRAGRTRRLPNMRRGLMNVLSAIGSNARARQPKRS
jgi:hypothetical protein